MSNTTIPLTPYQLHVANIVSNNPTQNPGTRPGLQLSIKAWICNKNSPQISKKNILHQTRTFTRKQIEDYPRGYPRFTSLISAHKPFHICRRFSQLRARLLLLKQDELSQLEQQLETIDQNEPSKLILGCQRRDKNPERKKTISDINTALQEYDALVERNYKMLNHQSPRSRDVAHLRNWLGANGSITPDETAYLSAAQDDLLCVAPEIDGPLVHVETLLQAIFISFSKFLGKRQKNSPSRAPNVHIFSGIVIKKMTRIIVAWGIILLLLLPVLVMNALSSVLLRMVVIFVSSAVVVLVLAISTNVTTQNLFLAGATYSTILVVFVAGNST